MNRNSRLAVAMTVTAVVLGQWAAAAVAQGYLPPINIDPNMLPRQKANRDAYTAKSRVISGIAPFDQQAQEDLRNWYERFVFAHMTWPEAFDQLADYRKQVLLDIRNTKTQELRDFILGITFNAMRKLAEDNYPPPTRVTAMLLISELNRTDRVPGNPYAVPFPGTFTYMQDQLKNPAQIDGVRVAALAGIYRHIESQWFLGQRPSDDLINGLTRDLLVIVNSAPPADRSPEAHAWFQGRAIDVLGSLSGWLPADETYQALMAVLANGQASLSLRCRAAYALGRMNYAALPTVNAIDVNALSRNVAGLLADACRREVTWLEGEKLKQAAKRSSTFGSAGPPGMGGGYDFGGFDPMTEGGGAGAGAGMGLGGEESDGSGYSFGVPGGGGDDGRGGNFSIPGMGGGTGAKEKGPNTGPLPQYKVDGARRRLLYEVSCVKASVNGPAPDADFKGLKMLAANNAAAQPTVTKIDAAITAIEAAVNKKDYVLDDMLKAVRLEMQTLDGLRPKPVATPATDVPSADVPSADVPSADVPSADVPSADVPSADVPSADVPPSNPAAPPDPSSDVPPPGDAP
jgi:hypothetical protein